MTNVYQTTIALALVALLGVPQAVGAANNEIHYQSIATVFGDTVLVADNGPGGEAHYLCDTDGECEKADDAVSNGLMAIRSAMGDISDQGRYGTLQIANPTGATALAIIDLKNGFNLVGNVIVSGSILKQSFSPDESKLIVVTTGGTVTTYDIDAETTTTVSISQTDLPFYNVSYRGTYISAYNYAHGVHRIWNTETGTQIELAGTPSYVEFSADESAAAYRAGDDDFPHLAVTTDVDSVPDTDTVASGGFVIEDYLYVGDTLFYMANKQSPLSWGIYRADTDERITDNASYGDYMQRIDDQLAYLTIEGKNANLYLYDPEHRASVRVDAAPQSNAASDITRTEIKIAGRTAALLSPEDADDAENLFIWLHGGPQRQTSLNYHPYLSYAVYDELLEKLASGGNHVLKLDYSGSWGYGTDFLERLEGRVGTVEIDDVLNVLEEFQKDHDVDNVYLIGNSYGGYMAFRAINEAPDEIDGIISINGVADWHGLIATIPSSPFSRLFNGSPDLHNLDLYRSASVFTNFDGLDDQPLLVFYGTNDRTVPTNQSRQYYEFMEANDKNVTLVAFDGEEHVLRKRDTLTELCTTITEKLDIDEVQCR